ncbi:unnamed protein product [Orchesella dallaii]|uniref:C2H2-type domain-containing protein n=1 Tax=Orchesella dallaii TaxID=48710 RepID=A0ABP1RYB8_9HEXA
MQGGVLRMPKEVQLKLLFKQLYELDRARENNQGPAASSSQSPKPKPAPTPFEYDCIICDDKFANGMEAMNHHSQTGHWKECVIKSNQLRVMERGCWLAHLEECPDCKEFEKKTSAKPKPDTDGRKKVG